MCCQSESSSQRVISQTVTGTGLNRIKPTVKVSISYSMESKLHGVRGRLRFKQNDRLLKQDNIIFGFQIKYSYRWSGIYSS